MEPTSETGQVKAIGTRRIPAGRKARTEAQRRLRNGVDYVIGRTDVTISMAIPDAVKAKHVHWSVTCTSLTLGVIGEPPMVDGQLWGRVLEDECHWQIDVVEVRCSEAAARRSMRAHVPELTDTPVCA